MKKEIAIPGLYRVQPNLIGDENKVALLSLNGRAAISSVLLSELEVEKKIIKDYDGQLSIGQEVYLEMSETGEVKASAVEKGAIASNSADSQNLDEKAIESIRKFDLSEQGGGVLTLTGNGALGLGEAIGKAGGRGPFTMSLIKAVMKATPDLSVAEHIVWQYIQNGESIHCKAYVSSSMDRIRFFGEHLFDPRYNTVTPHVFFREYVGKDYKNGLGGRRVLVLGESMFCDKDGQGKHRRCPFFDVCTDLKAKNSSAFDRKCSYSDVPLSEAVRDNVKGFLDGISEGDIKSYVNFTALMKDVGVILGKEDLFNRVIFYDFMQFYSPKATIEKSYLSERDDLALEEIIHRYNPDVVIIWGTRVGDRIKAKGKAYPRNIRGSVNPDYIFAQKIAGRWRTFFCIYHPSDRHGHLSASWDDHVKQARLVFR